MSYQTGSATDLDDLLSKLLTFATGTPGWTQDEFDTVNGKIALSKGNIYVSGRWDPASVQHLSLHQALGYTGGQEPGNHPDDSGSGYNTNSSHANTNLAGERFVHEIGDGPFTSYHFFEDDNYLHIVVQVSSGQYRHFGFGELVKLGTWTGGEYCYGHCMANSTSNNATRTLDVCILLDAIFVGSSGDQENRAPTMHCEGLPGMGGADKWGTFYGNTTQALLNDSAGNPRARLLGGFRGGPIAYAWGSFSGNNAAGFVPMYPITVFHYQSTGSILRPLGYQPDVRGISIENYAAEQEIVVGTDTWIVFPSGRRTVDSLQNQTQYQGIAYRKVTT